MILQYWMISLNRPFHGDMQMVIYGTSWTDACNRFGVYDWEGWIKHSYMIPSKTRHTRMSKYQAYIHACCREYGSADMHNIRYWRKNIRSMRFAKPFEPAIELVYNSINERVNNPIVDWSPNSVSDRLNALKIARMDWNNRRINERTRFCR